MIVNKNNKHTRVEDGKSESIYFSGVCVLQIGITTVMVINMSLNHKCEAKASKKANVILRT
jgi:hypothetical protein